MAPRGEPIVVTLPSAIPTGREIPCVPTAISVAPARSGLGEQAPGPAALRRAGTSRPGPPSALRSTPSSASALSPDAADMAIQPACTVTARSSAPMTVSFRVRLAARQPAGRLRDFPAESSTPQSTR